MTTVANLPPPKEVLQQALVALPASIKQLLDQLARQGELWFVGGAIVDFLTQKPVKDIDLVTTLSANQLRGHGGIAIGGGTQTHSWQLAGITIEISPLEVGQAIEDNLGLRDFTIHAMALTWPTATWLDPYGGYADLQIRQLRQPQPRYSPFTADPLRILRGIRRVGQGFFWQQETQQSAQLATSSLKEIAPERIGHEIETILRQPAASKACAQMVSWPHLLSSIYPLSSNHPCTWAPDWFLICQTLDLLPLVDRLAFFFYLPEPWQLSDACKKDFIELIAQTLNRWGIRKQDKQRAIELLKAHIGATILEQNTVQATRYWLACHEEVWQAVWQWWWHIACAQQDQARLRWLEDLKLLLTQQAEERFPRKVYELDVNPEALFEQLQISGQKRQQLLQALWWWALGDPPTRNQEKELVDQAVIIVKQK